MTADSLGPVPPAEADFTSRDRSAILALLVLVYTFNFIDRTIIATLGQAIKVDLRISDAQLGLLQGIAFAFFYTALGIPLARLAERVNRVSLISACLALWSGMTALCGTAASFGQLFLYRMGVGIGEAGCSPPAHSLITDLYAARVRASALAVYSLGIPLGTMFGAVSGGWLADGPGWRWAFVIVGLPGILLAIVFRIVVREPPRGLVDGASATADAPHPSFMDVMRRLFRKRSFVHILIGATLISFVGYGTHAFTQPYFTRAFDLSYTETGLIFGLISGTSAGLGILAGGLSTDWAGRRALHWYVVIPAISALLAAPGYILAYTREAYAVAAICLFVPTLLHYMYLGPSLGVMHNLVTARMRATATSIFFFVINLVGLGAGPYVTGLLNDLFAERAYLAVAGASFATSCPGSVAPAGAAVSLVQRCADAITQGTRAGLVIVTLVLAWAALHYFLSARTLKRDLTEDGTS